MRRGARLRLRNATRFTSALSIAILAACGGGDSGGPTPSEVRQDSASTVVGSGGGLVITPNGDAGVQIPPGVLGQNATITVAKLPTPGTPGQGPLPTSLNQYGPFYEISISPANAQLSDSVRVGVCQVTDPSSPFYPPEATHDQLRLAHTVGGATEILERVGVNDFLNCTGVTASIDERSGRSRLNRTFASLLNHTLGFLAPTTLHAAHGGLGGKVKSFSPFGAVDPLTGLVIGPEIAVSATPLEEGLGATATDGTNHLVTFSIFDGSTQSVPAAQLLSATGSSIGGQIVPIGATGESPVVAFDGTNYLMAWRTGASNPSLVGQFISRTGALVGATFTIATTGFPSASMLVFGGGTYLIVYTRQVDPNLGDFGYRTTARTISTSGVLGAQLQAGSVLGNDGFNNAAFDGTNFLVVYTDGTTLRGRFISPAGVLGFENTIQSAQNMSFLTPLAFNGTNYLIAFSAGQPFLDAFAILYSPAPGAIVGGRIDVANNSGDHELTGNVTASGSNFVVTFLDGLNAIGKIAIKGRVISGSGSTRLPAFTIAAPRDGKVAAGFIVNFNGSKYLANFIRGVQTSASDPLDLDTWTGKDSFISFLTIPIPP